MLPDLRHYTDIYLEGLRNFTETLSHNSRPSDTYTYVNRDLPNTKHKYATIRRTMAFCLFLIALIFF
jgi:hypothetical protein